MSERNERVEALLRSYVLERYREEATGHLTECPDTTVADVDARDGSYGCDTGCEYVRFEAVISCPHGERRDWEWGEFGELSWIIDDLIKQEAKQP